MPIPTPWVFVYQHLKNLRKAEANPEEISIARSLDFAAREGYLLARQIEYAWAELAAYLGECTSLAAAAYKAGMFPRDLDPLGPTDRYEFEIDVAAWLAGFTDGETVPWAAQGRRSFVFTEVRAGQEVWAKVADGYDGYDGWARHSSDKLMGYLCSRIADLRDAGVLSLEEYRLLGGEIDSYVNPVNAKGFLSYITTSAATLGAWPSDLARDMDGHAEFRRRFAAWKAGQPHGELPWAVNDLPAENLVQPKGFGVLVTEAEHKEAWLRVLEVFERWAAEKPGENIALCEVVMVAPIPYTAMWELHEEIGEFIPESEDFLPNAAWLAGMWPSDLDVNDRGDRTEFRRRFVHWRAGLPIGGELPWADRP